MQTASGHRFETLDGLRGIAALVVMFGHFGQILGVYYPANMFLAVDTFFAMSGFVISHSYSARLRQGMSPWKYLFRRVVRLYPMFVAGLIIGGGVLYYGSRTGSINYQAGDVLESVFVNALYIPYFNSAHIWRDAGQIFPADPPAWSLFLEMLASCGFLAIVGLRTKALVWICALLYVTLIAVGLHFAHVNGGSWIDISNGFDTNNYWGGFPRAAFGFTLGVLLHELILHGVGASRAQAIFERTPYPSLVLYAALLAVLLCPRTLKGLYPMAVLALVTPSIVFFGAHVPIRHRFETRLARFLGWISYPIYCLHVPVLRGVICLSVSRAPHPTPSWPPARLSRLFWQWRWPNGTRSRCARGCPAGALPESRLVGF